jgi:hypothetical protein
LSGNEDSSADGDYIVQRTVYAFLLSEALRPGASGTLPPAPPTDAAVSFTTYYPVPIESRYSMPLCPLILGVFATFLRPFVPVPVVVDSLEGDPVSLPLRSKAQVEFMETPERLAGGWPIGVRPHSHGRAHVQHGNGNAHDEKFFIGVHSVGFSTPFYSLFSCFHRSDAPP